MGWSWVLIVVWVARPKEQLLHGEVSIGCEWVRVFAIPALLLFAAIGGPYLGSLWQICDFHAEEHVGGQSDVVCRRLDGEGIPLLL